MTLTRTATAVRKACRSPGHKDVATTESTAGSALTVDDAADQQRGHVPAGQCHCPIRRSGINNAWEFRRPVPFRSTSTMRWDFDLQLPIYALLPASMGNFWLESGLRCPGIHGRSPATTPSSPHDSQRRRRRQPATTAHFEYPACGRLITSAGPTISYVPARWIRKGRSPGRLNVFRVRATRSATGTRQGYFARSASVPAARRA